MVNNEAYAVHMITRTLVLVGPDQKSKYWLPTSTSNEAPDFTNNE